MNIGKMGFGVYKITDEEKMYKALDTALNVGYKLIDTATYYKNEEFIGKFLRNYRNKDEIVVTTKVWPSDMSYDEIIPIASDFREFIRAIGTAQYAVWKKDEKNFVELMSKEIADNSLIFWKALVGVY